MTILLRRSHCFIPTMITLMAVGSPVAADEPAASPPVLQSADLPTPPQQNADWNPPAEGIPPRVLSAARTLFDQGLADPRGCEYREVEVFIGRVYGGRETVSTHGWVLPKDADAPDDGPRFVVLWNGWVYPVGNIGEPADVAADVVATLSAMRQRRSDWQQEHPTWRYSPSSHCGEAVNEAGLHGVTVCLLLRLGHYRLAGQVCSSIFPPDENRQPDDPYRDWASDWLYAGFVRTIYAFRDGDDATALVTARTLMRIHPSVEARATALGFKQFPVRWGSLQTPPSSELVPHVPFLSQIPELVRDLELRRILAVRPRPTIPFPTRRAGWKSVLGQYAKRPAEDAVFVLGEISTHPVINSEGFFWDDEPLICLIGHRGYESVPALLNLWENGPRFTRSIRGPRGSNRGMSIVGIEEPLRCCLGHIGVRGSTLAEARADWEVLQQTSQAERWYATLCDDDAGSERWLLATQHIVQPTDVVTTFTGESYHLPCQLGAPRLRGESLRSKSAPSVLELLEKRAAQISELGLPGQGRRESLRDGCRIALAAAAWEPAGATRILADQHRRTVDYIEAMPSRWSDADRDLWKVRIANLGPMLTHIAAARVTAGDCDAAVRDYGDFVLSGAPEAWDALPTQWLPPAWQGARRPLNLRAFPR